jgi:hypothetical protein
MRNPFKNTFIVGLLGAIFTVLCAVVVCVFSKFVWCKVACILFVAITSFMLCDIFYSYSFVSRHIKLLKHLSKNPHLIRMFIEESNEKEKFEKE